MFFSLFSVRRTPATEALRNVAENVKAILQRIALL
jgi:hypothetical protein